MKQQDDNIVVNPWGHLKQFTNARIALGRTGVSLPTREMLEFQLAHARARDSVQSHPDFYDLEMKLKAVNHEWEFVHLQSRIYDKKEYLIRPDKGRILSKDSRESVIRDVEKQKKDCDICLVIADGLSSGAVMKNAVPLLNHFKEKIESNRWKITPINFLRYGRVACGDDIASLYQAKLVVILIGERPGLSSPESMGAYITWNPIPGITKDERRNCISNIHREGLLPTDAAEKMAFLIKKMFRMKLSGIELKDDQVIFPQPLELS